MSLRCPPECRGEARSDEWAEPSSIRPALRAGCSSTAERATMCDRQRTHCVCVCSLSSLAQDSTGSTTCRSFSEMARARLTLGPAVRSRLRMSQASTSVLIARSGPASGVACGSIPATRPAHSKVYTDLESLPTDSTARVHLRQHVPERPQAQQAHDTRTRRPFCVVGMCVGAKPTTSTTSSSPQGPHQRRRRSCLAATPDRRC